MDTRYIHIFYVKIDITYSFRDFKFYHCLVYRLSYKKESFVWNKIYISIM